MKRRGLTLIELLVALTVFALAAVALVVTLRNGLRTWDRVTRVSDRQAQVRFALDVLARDAMHAVLLTGANDVPPLFDDTTVSFVTVYRDERQQLPRLERVLVRAETGADGTIALVRRAAPYPAAPDGPLGASEILLPSVSACRFAYLFYDAQTRAMSWEPQWGTPGEFPPALPRAVRVTVEGSADLPAALTYAYEIPTGLPGSLEESPP